MVDAARRPAGVLGPRTVAALLIGQCGAASRAAPQWPPLTPQCRRAPLHCECCGAWCIGVIFGPLSVHRRHSDDILERAAGLWMVLWPWTTRFALGARVGAPVFAPCGVVARESWVDSGAPSAQERFPWCGAPDQCTSLLPWAMVSIGRTPSQADSECRTWTVERHHKCLRLGTTSRASASSHAHFGPRLPTTHRTE